MKERFQDKRIKEIGEIVLFSIGIHAGLIGTLATISHIQNQQIDDICGGPKRPDCIRTERIEEGIACGLNSWPSCAPYERVIIEFFPKSTERPFDF